MKRTGVIFFVVCWSTLSFSQVVLTYEDHALKPGEDNPMSYCSYLDPGPEGSDVRWDFNGLRYIKSFEGKITSSSETEFGSVFPESNTVLAEFDSRFYFRIDEDRIEQYGYSSADGRNRIHYTDPFVKMEFPFSFGSAFSGIFGGTAIYSGTLKSDISGSYSVEADAYGTLILPGNTTYENTIRIRTEKEYVQQFGHSEQGVRVLTYRWYNEAHRYPLLVLTSYTTTTGQAEHTSYQAAYNVNALKSVDRFQDGDVEIYPNPTARDLNIRINALTEGEYQFGIYSTSGELVSSFARVAPVVGLHDFDLSEEIAKLKPGTYILKISNGSTRVSGNFILME
ncbi:MAG: T9SS type A sorting domain-containing protein [Bacteroidales bacterium]|jgi:hypothetical protein